MSPAPARTSQAGIVGAARELLEEGGLEAVTMAAVASRVGVRAASLYKHVRDRETLLVAVGEDAADELAAVLAAATDGRDEGAEARIVAIATAFRAFARRRPRSATLLFTDLGPGTGLPVEASARAAQPVLDAAAALVGPERALLAARVLTAFVFGFTTMEAAGAFRLGGEPEAAFGAGLEAITRGLRT